MSWASVVITAIIRPRSPRRQLTSRNRICYRGRPAGHWNPAHPADSRVDIHGRNLSQQPAKSSAGLIKIEKNRGWCEVDQSARFGRVTKVLYEKIIPNYNPGMYTTKLRKPGTL
jgi:hypothetical protein